MIRTITLLAMATILLAPPAWSQIEFSEVEIVPSVALYMPHGAFGQTRDRSGSYQADNAFAVGLAADFPTVWPRIHVRWGAHSVLSGGVYQHQFSGITSCGTNCYRAQYQNPTVGSATLFATSFDVVWSLMPSQSSVQLSAMAGPGWRKRWVSPTIDDTALSRTDNQWTDGWVAHLGLGAEWRIRQVTLVAELHGYADDLTARPPFVTASNQADTFLSFGLRIPR